MERKIWYNKDTLTYFMRLSKPVLVGLFILFIGIVFWGLEDQGLFNQEIVIERLENLPDWAPLIYILLYMIVSISFLPATPFSLAAGALFGSVWGSFYIMIGATLGSGGAFLISRFLFRQWSQNLVNTKFPSLHKYDEALAHNGLATVLFFRLVPLFPFNGLNLGLGITNVSFLEYIMGTVLGILPGVFILSFLGDSIGSGNVQAIVLGLILYGGVASTGILYNRWKKSK